jgi:YbbR domain-containing protein
MNKNLENIVKRNFWLKIISLLFAILIWGYVIGGKKYDVVYNARLNIYSLPKGYAVSNTLPKKVFVKLRGSRIAFMKLNKEIIFKINGSSLLSKKNTLILSRFYLNIPSGIHVIRIHPKIIPVILSRIIVRYIKILPITKGQLGKGYYIRNIITFPQYVKVKGPKDIVDHLSVITTKKINLSKYKSNTVVKTFLIRPTKLIKILYNKKINVNLIIGGLKK